MANRWLTCFRHLATCIIRSPLPHHHDVTPLSLHSSQSSPSLPWLARSLSFRMRHDNAFLCPSPQRCCTCLSHIVTDSDVCAPVLVSCSRSCLLTSIDFVLVTCFLNTSLCRQVSPHSFPVSHIALLPQVAPRLSSRSDLLQDLGGLHRCQHGP